MTFPLYALDHMGYEIGLVAFTLVGVGFGFVLERSGFGRSPILAAQFYGTNTRVLKVMFTAIVTALVGMTVLSGVGMLDMSAVTVPHTYLWPHLVGGLLLGVGFVISGYCPGTSVVASASGNIDGVFTIVGVVLGSLVFGAFYPVMESFYHTGYLGRLTFSDLLGVHQSILAAGVFVMAVGAFFFGEWAEKFFSKRRKIAPPASDPATRNRVFALLGILAAVGFVGLAAPAPVVVPVEKTVASMDAMTLARTLVEHPESVYVVDARDPSSCKARRVPGAMCMPADDAGGAFMKDLPPTRKLVVYGTGDLARVPDGALGYGGEVLSLEGGFDAFNGLFLVTPVPPANGTPAELARYEVQAALHGYLTGAKTRPAPARPAPVKMQRRKVKKGGGC